MSLPTKTYFLLQEPAPGHRIFDLLGRAVYIDGDSLKNPTAGLIKPRLPPVGPNLQTLEENLYPKHVEAKSAELLLERAHDESARASISKVLGLFYKHSKSNQSTMSTTAFRRITMEEQHTKIQSLLQNQEYYEPIVDFLGENPEARFGVIVSLISCFEMEVGKKKAEEHEGGGNATVPGETMGAPSGAGDIAAEVKVGANTKSELSGTYKDEVIMACGYLEMRLKKHEKGWKFWESHKPSPYDITFTARAIDPRTMTVSLPPTRIEGNQEPMLGGPITKGKIKDVAEASQVDEGLDFMLYAQCQWSHEMRKN